MLINKRIGMLVQRGSQLYLFCEVVKLRSLSLMDHARAEISHREIDFFQIASIGGPKDGEEHQNGRANGYQFELVEVKFCPLSRGKFPGPAKRDRHQSFPPLIEWSADLISRWSE